MKFICDQMLAGLGRWLRAAGYDTKIVETSCDDREIFERAHQEERILLTRDRHFPNVSEAVILLKANATEDCVKELGRRLDIDWTKKPFSRCLLCNQELIEANEEWIEKAPKKVQQWCKQFWVCARCGKVYWRGSHTERMLRKLERFSHIRQNDQSNGRLLS